MVEAWVMSQVDGSDQRDEQRLSPNVEVSLQELEAIGVVYWHLDVDKDTEKLEEIKSSRGYTYSDVIHVSKQRLENYEEKIKSFYEEHMHTDEEIRFVLEGSGYFDVRDASNTWIRISLERGDMIVLPAGIYHRFTLDHGNEIKAMRLFVGEPVWTPYNRPQEEHPVRREYVQRYISQK